ncbi:DNA polymerase II [Dirofilaria immitis]
MLRSSVEKMAFCSIKAVDLLNKGYRKLHSFDRQRRLELFCNEQRRQAMVYEKKIEKVFWTIEDETENDPVIVLMKKFITSFFR